MYTLTKISEVVNFVATTHLRVKRDATEATVARYLLTRKEL